MNQNHFEHDAEHRFSATALVCGEYHQRGGTSKKVSSSHRSCKIGRAQAQSNLQPSERDYSIGFLNAGESNGCSRCHCNATEKAQEGKDNLDPKQRGSPFKTQRRHGRRLSRGRHRLRRYARRIRQQMTTRDTDCYYLCKWHEHMSCPSYTSIRCSKACHY